MVSRATCFWSSGRTESSRSRMRASASLRAALSSRRRLWPGTNIMLRSSSGPVMRRPPSAGTRMWRRRRQHPLAALVEGPGLDQHHPAVRVRGRAARLEHLGLGADGVADEHRPFVAHRLVVEVGDGPAADVGHAHPHRQRQHQGAHHQDAAVLLPGGVLGVGVHRVRVAGEQAEEVVVALGDGLGRPVAEGVAHPEVLQAAAEGGLHVVVHRASCPRGESTRAARGIAAVTGRQPGLRPERAAAGGQQGLHRPLHLGRGQGVVEGQADEAPADVVGDGAVGGPGGEAPAPRGAVQRHVVEGGHHPGGPHGGQDPVPGGPVGEQDVVEVVAGHVAGGHVGQGQARRPRRAGCSRRW